jgi:hypothetical protein
MQAVSELLAVVGPVAGGADVGSEAPDLADRDQGFQSGPGADIPAVGCGEGVGAVRACPAEPAVHVVDLGEVPLARTGGDVIPVSQDGLAGSGAHEVADVRVPVDQAGVPGKVQRGPLPAQRGDAVLQPGPAGRGHGVRGLADLGGDAGEGVIEAGQRIWRIALRVQVAQDVPHLGAGRCGRAGGGDVAPGRHHVSGFHERLVIDVGRDGAREAAVSEPARDGDGGGDGAKHLRVGGDPDDQAR